MFHQSSCVQQLAAEMYSDSAVDIAIVVCLMVAQDIRFSQETDSFH